MILLVSSDILKNISYIHFVTLFSNLTPNMCNFSYHVEKSESIMYDIIKRIFLKKKIWESSALRAESAKQAARQAKEAAEKEGNDADKVETEQNEKKAREVAVQKVNEIRAELNVLYQKQAEVEKEIGAEYKTKIEDYEKRSYQEEDVEIAKMQKEHEEEIQQLIAKLKEESELDRKKKDAIILGIKGGKDGGDYKRKAAEEGGVGNSGEPSLKRQKLEEGSAGAETGEISETASNLKADDTAGQGGDDDDVEEGEEVLQSAVKEKELKVRTILQCDVLFFIVCGCH